MLAISKADLAKQIDYSLLRSDLTAADLERFCQEAVRHAFYAVCVNGAWVEQARHFLEDSDVKVSCAVAFPLGAASGDAKRFEVEAAIDDGAQEIDVVLNVGALKSGADKQLLRELFDVVEAADERPVKVILEAGLLTREEILRACELIVESGARFVSTSTGYGPPATVEQVKLLREAVGPKFGVKACGGIRSIETALALVEAGATRIGTSTAPALLGGW
ncbi:MAG TPA: deoxyribose-phosphate aldolase [Verrucomicrobia bacterium]|nr:deoxyribose-phosphate aldolase [Verrucomicrobiota bacterium]HOB31419.1 deoxyribose-phosphate aldolase [Verrucomicrobiota bacterium]HOP97429.1 deoxyribose-phosphate aldolase [Verrucomicrobiota bacterium]HPU54688.1 deoxyribose-phosphate aldolase [Verrucomicrobiota bacterium]